MEDNTPFNPPPAEQAPVTVSPDEKKYRLAIRRPVAITMFFATLLVFGWKSYQQLPVNLMPNISYPTLTVRTEYDGAAPEDVEKLVTRPLEEALSIVSGVVEVSSVSTPSISEIVLEFNWGTDMNLALQEVRDRLDLFEPPKEVTEKPIILRYDPSLDPVIRVAITGSDFASEPDPVRRRELISKELTSIREIVERQLKADLEAEPGIAQVLVKGGRQQEIQVSVDSARLKNVGVSMQDVVNALAQQNINLSGGRLREGRTEYLVRTLNEFQRPEEIGEIVVTSASGGRATLKDVARVYMGEKDRDTIVLINGREAVALDIFKEGDANTVEVCNHVKDVLGFERELSFMEKLSARMASSNDSEEPQILERSGTPAQLRKKIESYLPDQSEFTLISDQSRFIKGAIQEVQDATVQGGILALIVLILFLKDISTTLIIGVAIPISLVTAFIPMFAWDITLNVMSLGGLALGVGSLIDDSIVVLESIFRCQEEGDSKLEAAERGTQEVAVPVISTTLTTVVVFLPIAFVEGVAGQMFSDFGLTMSFALFASLLVALYLNPMMVARLSMAGGLKGMVQRAEASGRNLGPRALVGRFNAMVEDSLGPSIRSIGAIGQGGVATLKGLFAILFLPLTLIWFLLQLAMMIIMGAIFGVIVLIAIAIGGILWAATKALQIVLWLPLTVFELLFNGFKKLYTIALHYSLRFGGVVLLILLGLTIHSGYVAQGLGRELIPALRQGEFSIRMEAPPGTQLEETEERARRIEAVIMATPEVASVGTQIGVEKDKTGGDRGENIATFNVVLKNPEETAPRQDEIIARMRDQINAVASEPISFALPTLFSFKTAVEVQVRGDDYNELRRVGERTLAALKDIEGLKDVELSVKRGYPEVLIELDREMLAARGLAALTVAQNLRTELQGDVATRFSKGGEKIDIRVRGDEERLQTLRDLESLSIVDSSPPVPLGAVAKITLQDGPSEIRRVDQRQVVMVRGNVEGFDLGRVSREIEKRLVTVQKPVDYTFVLGGQNRDLGKSYDSLVFALILSVLLVYAIMACQFESIIQPFLVLSTIPMAFVGVIYTQWWLDLPISVAVFMGGILLVGIVVDNGMLLVDYANLLRERGYTRRQAIFESGQVRMRPVVMTAITTAIGMAPMAIYGGEGAELRQPLAITVIAGIACATVLTLIVIPVVYDMFGGRDKA
jgi:HAE1 family hydrophobic/amphiphilic exporter-1